MTDAFVARSVGVSRQCLSNWFRGVSRPADPAVANRLRKLLNIDAELWFEEASKERT